MLLENFEDRIRELKQLVPSNVAAIVEDQCRENLRLYPHPERSEFQANALPHSYGPHTTVICNGQFGRIVFEEMKKDGACSAPTLSRQPIRTGKVEVLWPLDDMIFKFVDEQRQTVYNVTLPKHIFFPGFVQLEVREERTATSVAVSGKGIGNWGTPNELLAPSFFGSILRRYLVPRVERRLKGRR